MVGLTENSTLFLGYINLECFIQTYTYKLFCLIDEAISFKYSHFTHGK